MSAWAPVAAGRTVQRGCEPRAMEPPSKETCEDNSSRLDIGITPGLFNDAPGVGMADGEALLVALTTYPSPQAKGGVRCAPERCFVPTEPLFQKTPLAGLVPAIHVFFL